MGLVLLVVIWLITLVSTYYFVAQSWVPHGASAAAPWIDHQFTLTLIIMGIVFLAAQLSLGWLAWKYRDGPGAGPAEYSHGNVKRESIWPAMTAILFVGLSLMVPNSCASDPFEPAKPDAVKVDA